MKLDEVIIIYENGHRLKSFLCNDSGGYVSAFVFYHEHIQDFLEKGFEKILESQTGKAGHTILFSKRKMSATSVSYMTYFSVTDATGNYFYDGCTICQLDNQDEQYRLIKGYHGNLYIRSEDPLSSIRFDREITDIKELEKYAVISEPSTTY